MIIPNNNSKLDQELSSYSYQKAPTKKRIIATTKISRTTICVTSTILNRILKSSIAFKMIVYEEDARKYLNEVTLRLLEGLMKSKPFTIQEVVGTTLYLSTLLNLEEIYPMITFALKVKRVNSNRIFLEILITCALTIYILQVLGIEKKDEEIQTIDLKMTKDTVGKIRIPNVLLK